MSIRVMTMVWDGYPGGGTELLAMLALADWSDDQGRCYPSMAAIASKTRLSTSQARRVIHKLIDDEFVWVTGNLNGGPPGATRQYRIMLSRLTARMDAIPTACTDARGTASTDARDGLHGCAQTASTGASQTVSEPSGTVKGEGAPSCSPSPARDIRKSGGTLRTFLEGCKTNGEKIIPEDDPIFDYAEKVGIEQEMLTVCWQEFKGRFLPTDKRQKDWRAHFRNAVRRNWFNLWFLRDGEPARWTTAGEQARRAAA